MYPVTSADDLEHILPDIGLSATTVARDPAIAVTSAVFDIQAVGENQETMKGTVKPKRECQDERW